MTKNEPVSLLIDFSKNLLITIFAIFAFTSGPLLTATNLGVKISYIFSLLAAVLALNFGYRGITTIVNYHITLENNGKQKSDNRLPKGKLRSLQRYIQKQFIFSICSLVLLVISVCLFCFTDNHPSVYILNN